MSNPPEFKKNKDVLKPVSESERHSGLGFRQSMDLHKYTHKPKQVQEQMKPVDYLSKMAGDVLTNKTERKEALDALYLNNDFFEKVGEEIRQEKAEKDITRIQQALKEQTDVLQSLKKDYSNLETARSLLNKDTDFLKNATPEQINKIYADTQNSLDNLYAINAKLGFLDSAKKNMSKAQEIEGIEGIS